ncbi:hypothetical protein ACLOJK_022569 [Asimina triloba]
MARPCYVTCLHGLSHLGRRASINWRSYGFFFKITSSQALRPLSPPGSAPNPTPQFHFFLAPTLYIKSLKFFLNQLNYTIPYKKQAVSKPRYLSRPPREPKVPQLPWEVRDDTMQQRYAMLSKRPVVCTRYVDEESMSHLGITDLIQSWAQSIGWSFFLSMRPPTLIELTLEFVSSLECDFNLLADTEAPSIKFRLLGQEFALSIRRLNVLFEFPNVGEPSIPIDFIPRVA